MNKILLLIYLIFIGTCSQTTQSDNPAWVHQMIEKFQNEPIGNPPQSIWRYDYEGETVYYIPAQCCDKYSSLYDKDGKVICAPDGGISGRGDGRCPYFFQKRTEEKLIWKDPRSR
jgi:hypothetical protein